MGKTTAKPKALKSASTGIMPFLEKAATAFPNMMRRATQAAADWRQKKKHSEMQKPYLNDPDLPWPSIDSFEPMPISVEAPYINASDWTNINQAGSKAYKFQCIVKCEHVRQANKAACDDPIRCRFLAWTLGDPLKWSVVAYPPYYDEDSEFPEIGKIEWREDLNEVLIWPPVGGWGINIGEFGNYFQLRLQYTDKGQVRGKYFHPILNKMITIEEGVSVCHSDLQVKCYSCPPETSISFDDSSTPDTIAPGGNITVYVLDGEPPFTWSVPDTGYSFAASKTNSRSNTLNCVSGTCGVDYDAVANLTITDYCDESATAKIRNTGGQWIDQNYGSVCGLTGNGTQTGSGAGPPQWWTYELIVGDEKQTQKTEMYGGASGCNPPCDEPGFCYDQCHNRTNNGEINCIDPDHGANIPCEYVAPPPYTSCNFWRAVNKVYYKWSC